MVRPAFVALAMTLTLAGCDRPAASRAAPIEGLSLAGRVVDAAGILDARAEAALTARAADLEKRTSDQLVIVTTPSLHGKPIEKVAYALGSGWGIGRKDLDNGVLVLVAPTEKEARIEVGKGLEALLTDARAGDIMAEMTGRFRTGAMADGIAIGAEEIADLLEKDPRRPRSMHERKAA